ncbi:hypothetical protein [Solibacillus cecembensis]|uniref:hypothetical protein n=1 Tax=Solibacillus cecembensis TaxID=459347 RepID=UPI003D04A6AC
MYTKFIQLIMPLPSADVVRKYVLPFTTIERRFYMYTPDQLVEERTNKKLAPVAKTIRWNLF